MNEKKKCYESQHLHPKEFALLTVCQRLTRGGKTTLRFDGRAMAARFAGTCKSSMYRSANKLVAAGWLVPINGLGQKIRTSDGKYEPTEFTVLVHDGWVAKHGDADCAHNRPEVAEPEPVPTMGTGDSEPVPNEVLAPVPEMGTVQSQSVPEPVPNEGHSFVTAFVKEPLSFSLSEPEAQKTDLQTKPNGQGLNALNGRLFDVGGHTFTGIALKGLAALREHWTDDEIVEAFDAFTKEREHYQRPYGPKNFTSDGAASALALLPKARIEVARRKAAQDMLPVLKASLRAKAVLEQEERDRAAAAEAVMADDPFFAQVSG